MLWTCLELRDSWWSYKEKNRLLAFYIKNKNLERVLLKMGLLFDSQQPMLLCEFLLDTNVHSCLAISCTRFYLHLFNSYIYSKLSSVVWFDCTFSRSMCKHWPMPSHWYVTTISTTTVSNSFSERALPHSSSVLKRCTLLHSSRAIHTLCANIYPQGECRAGIQHSPRTNGRGLLCSPTTEQPYIAPSCWLWSREASFSP